VTILPQVRFEGSQAVTVYNNTTNPDGKIHPDHIRATKGKNYL
jgi:hypothetical protein